MHHQLPTSPDNIWQEFVQLSVASGGSANACRTGMHEKDTHYYYRVRIEWMSNVRIMMDCMVSEQPTAINRTAD
jgi:hypothetical protein